MAMEDQPALSCMVVHLTDNQCTHQRQQGVARLGAPHAAYHPECRKAGSDGGSDVRVEGDAALDVDSKVTDDTGITAVSPT